LDLHVWKLKTLARETHHLFLVWKFSFLQLSIATSTRWESNCLFQKLASRQGFVSVSATGVSYMGGQPMSPGDDSSSWALPGAGDHDPEEPSAAPKVSLSSRSGGHTLGSGSSSSSRGGLKPGGNQALAQKYASKIQKDAGSSTGNEVSITQLVSLGYTREDAAEALAQTGGDVRKAQQYLSGGL
jgi:hypothetical protein